MREIYIYIYIGGLMGNIYIYIPKRCNLQLMKSLSLFLSTFSTGCSNPVTCSNNNIFYLEQG